MSDPTISVFVVEDNEGDVRMIERGLDASDLAIDRTVVTDGEAALDRLLRSTAGASPDLVILDLNVPKRTGQDVLSVLQAERQTRSFPILVLSGSRSDEHIRETLELGADGYFVKPVDPIEFISLIETVVETVYESGSVPPGEHATLL